ncbi:hypothetical protein BUALT_Bualt12G0054000 [Buddleja alternifolia]|uniref:F-box domain-containing protein n=1 Tax=Buddleja alternifolia TaxID=168488 RepID=A0AAV6WP29_9LAMI|nr:hypothetical protein BUALT_Bualt12G0054000 [Buddleja alternifolia]
MQKVGQVSRWPNSLDKRNKGWRVLYYTYQGLKTMSMLPDDLWNRIMEIGIGTKSLNYKDICRLSTTCRRLRRLADDNSVWSPLLLSGFPTSRMDLHLISIAPNSDSTLNRKVKSLYKTRYEKEREQKRLAHRRVVLRIESEKAELLRPIQERELQSSLEKEKLKEAIAELRNLWKARY